MAHIWILVDNISFSWKDKNGDILHIHNNNKLKDCLQMAVSSGTTQFVLHAHCDNLYFAPDFNDLNLDQADTAPFPAPISAPFTPASAPGIDVTPALVSVVPPTDIFNYKALPSQVQQRHNDHQDSNKNLCAQQDMIPYIWHDGSSQYYYTDPTLIGSRVILCNGAILDSKLNYKKFALDPPIYNRDNIPILRSRYRVFMNHAPDQFVTKINNIVGWILTQENPKSICN
jgi:hypothetical protein